MKTSEIIYKNNEKKENDMNKNTITLTPEESQAAFRSIIGPAATKANSNSKSKSMYGFIEREYPRLRAIREAEDLSMKKLYRRIQNGEGKSLSFRTFTTYYYRAGKSRAAEEKAAEEASLVGGEGNQPNATTFVQSGFTFSMDLRRVKGDDPQSLISIFPDWIAERRAEKENAFLEDFIRNRELVIQSWGIESGPFCTSDAVLVASEFMRAFLVTRGTCEGDLRVDIGLRIHDMEGGLAEWLDSDQHPENDLMDEFTSRTYHIYNGLFLPERLYEDEKKEAEELKQARQEAPEPMPVKEQSKADDVQRGYVFEMRLEDISIPASSDEDDAEESMAAKFKRWMEDDLDYNSDLLDAIHEKSILIGDFGIRSGAFCSASTFETAAHAMGRFIYEMGGKRAGLSFEAEVGKYRNGRLLGMQHRPRLFRIENQRVWRPTADSFCKDIDRVPA